MTPTPPSGYANSVSALSIPDVTGLTVPQAALEYAACGWYVLPVDPADPKNPGSLVLTAWQHKSSRDPAVIAAWWQQWPDALIALHTGRSGAVALDLDAPARIPAVLDKHRDGMAFQSTRASDPLRGHYVGTCRPMEFGCSTGGLGKGWGEVRSGNSVIIAEPSPRAEPEKRYLWQRTELYPVPAEIAACLRPPGASYGSADTAEVLDFLSRLPRSDDAWCPYVAGLLAEPVPSGSGRYDDMGSRVQKLVRAGEQGHLNAPAALEAYQDALYAEVHANPNGWDVEAAWDQRLATAVGNVLADPTPQWDKGCCGSNDGIPTSVGYAPAVGLDVPVNFRTGQPVAAANENAPAPEAAVQLLPARRIVRTLASDIKPRRVRWLWKDRLPAGEFSIIGGREGQGKSLAVFDRAALITRGKLDGEFRGTPRPVAVIATEDAWAETIVPRLIAAKADLSMVHKLSVATEFDTETELDLPVDNDLLRAELAGSGAVLLILDPLMSRLSAALDSHKDADVRRALEPLARIAHDTGCAILGILHVNKSGGTDALNALMGSRAFAAVPRSVQFVMADPTDETGQRRLYATVKSNLGRSDLPLLAFTIGSVTVGEDDGQPVTAASLRWGGAADGTVAGMLAAALRGPERETAVDKAAGWLTGYLRQFGGRAESGEVKAAGKKAGHAEATLKRAMRQAEVVPESEGFPRRTYWVLCDDSASVGSRARGDEPTEPTGALETSRELTTTHWPAETSSAPVGSVGSAGSSPREADPTVMDPADLCPRCGGSAIVTSMCAHHPGAIPLRCEVCA